MRRYVAQYVMCWCLGLFTPSLPHLPPRLTPSFINGRMQDIAAEFG